MCDPSQVPVSYRKKPVLIEAMRWTGFNVEDIHRWIEGQAQVAFDDYHVIITTLEGVMSAEVGSWIIKGVAGEFYPCQPDIFEQTYEPA